MTYYRPPFDIFLGGDVSPLSPMGFTPLVDSTIIVDLWPWTGHRRLLQFKSNLTSDFQFEVVDSWVINLELDSKHCC